MLWYGPRPYWGLIIVCHSPDVLITHHPHLFINSRCDQKLYGMTGSDFMGLAIEN